MKQINLLSGSLRKRNSQRLLIEVSFGGILIGTLGVLLLYTAMHAQVAAHKEQLTRLEGNAKILATKNSLQSLETTGDDTQRITYLNTLAKSEVDWKQAFDLIGAIIPQDISITSYSYASASTNTILKVVGSAPSNVSFAVFIESVKSNKSITSVKVDSYSYDPKSGRVSFACTVAVPLTTIDYSK